MGFSSETLEKSLRGEPDWLHEKRRSALAAYERLPLPSKTDEEWRRTDVSRLNVSDYTELEHKNGFKLVGLPALPNGVILEPLRTAAEKHARGTVPP